MRTAKTLTVTIGAVLLAATVSAPSQATPPASPVPGTVTEYALPVANSDPMSAAEGPDGNMWFTQGVANVVSVRDAVSGQITSYPIPTPGGHPNSITEGPDGDMWFTQYYGKKIGKIDPATGVITEYTPPSAGYLDQIITGPDGQLWFADAGGDQIGAFNPDNESFTMYPITGSQPWGVAVGPDNHIWFTVRTGGIGKINPDTGDITYYEASGTPVGITAGPDGNMWFTQATGNNIARITISGTITEYPIPTANALPIGIALGADGNLWFTEATAGQIGSITPATGEIYEYPIPTGDSRPWAISPGPDRYMWFGQRNSGTLAMIRVKDEQTITFDALDDKYLMQSPATMTATTSSNEAVTFTTTTPAVCSAGGTDGATITLNGTGTCTVRASQPGGAQYNSATSVDRSFIVDPNNPPQPTPVTRSGQDLDWSPVRRATSYFVMYRVAGSGRPWGVYATGSSQNAITLTNPGQRQRCSASNIALGFTNCAMPYGWQSGQRYEFAVYSRNSLNRTSIAPLVSRLTYTAP